MVAARRSFEGVLPVAAMKRLGGALAGDAGEAAYQLDFGRDGLGVAYLGLKVRAPLTLLCQRSLEPFVSPVVLDARLGLIRAESEEAALPPGYEPLLVPEDGKLHPAEVIEDELLLALPLVPVNPDSVLPEEVTGAGAEEPAAAREDNPFAVLRELKKTNL